MRLSPDTLAALHAICDARERGEPIRARDVMRLGRLRPFAVDIAAIYDGLDSDQLDAIEDNCIRRGVLPPSQT